MSPKSTKKTALVRDTDLASRIAKLRTSKAMSQRAFAKELGVTQAQISEWEKGTERPSLEKLIALGNLSPDPSVRMFFWRRAGVSETRLREDLAADLLQTLAKQTGVFFAAPLAKRIFVGSAGQLQLETDGTMAVPSILVSPAGTTFCMRVPESRLQFPSLYPVGDYVVIERASDDLDKLDGSPVAVYLDATPEGFELPFGSDAYRRFTEMVEQARRTSEAERIHEQNRADEEQRLNRALNPNAAAASDQHNDEVSARIVEALGKPIVLFGRLAVQYSPQSQFESWSTRLSRVVLELSAQGESQGILPLSEWKVGCNAIEPRILDRIRDGVRVIGPIVGWFKDRSQRSPEGIESEK